jgi:hypothetical protein
MKKQIFVDDNYDYDYQVVNDNVHTLSRSYASQWPDHVRGEVALKIEDDGNGLVVRFNEKGRIDYSEAEQLFILLKLIIDQAKYEISTKQPL